MRSRQSLFAAGMLLFLLTGCAATGTAKPAAVPEFRQNITTWALPLDAFVVSPNREQYAQSILYSQCMKKLGYNIPAYDAADFIPPTRNQNLRKLFNVYIAEKYGYHNGPTRRNPASYPHPQLDSGGQEADKHCSSASSTTLQYEPGQINYIQGLAAQAEGNARQARPVVDAARMWHECMLPLGISDLADSPDNMPTPSQRERFGMNVGGADNVSQTTEAAPEEIRQAVFDAKCRESTHVSEVLYQTEVQIQEKEISANQEDVSRALDAAKRMTSAVADTLEHYGN